MRLRGERTHRRENPILRQPAKVEAQRETVEANFVKDALNVFAAHDGSPKTARLEAHAAS